MGSRRRLARCCWWQNPNGTWLRTVDRRGDFPDLDGRLSDYMQAVLATMAEFALALGMAPPDVLSTCRSRALQNELIRRWERGEREGLAYAPSRTSKHIPDASGVCRAFDLANTEAWIRRVAPWTRDSFKYLEWGGDYLPPDIRHFEEKG